MDRMPEDSLMRCDKMEAYAECSLQLTWQALPGKRQLSFLCTVFRHGSISFSCHCFSVNFQFLLGHLLTALMQRTHRLWVMVGMAPPGKRRVEKNLVGDALGTWGYHWWSQREITPAPDTSQLYIYLILTKSIFSTRQSCRNFTQL